MNSEWRILQNRTARVFPSLTRRSNISSVTSSISSFSNCDSNHSKISSSFSTSPTIVQFHISFNSQTVHSVLRFIFVGLPNCSTHLPTIVKIRDLFLEVHDRWHRVDPKVLRSFLVVDFHELYPVLVAIVVNLLELGQHLHRILVTVVVWNDLNNK